MSKIRVDLTEKQLFLLIEALKVHIKELDIKAESTTTSEDEYSDIQNDFITLKPMLIQLEEILEQ